MVNLKINNIPVQVKEGTTILDAAKSVGINIPTLCYLKDINEIGACRVCVVEVKGARSLVASCVYPVNEGMEVFTNTEKVRKSRKTTIELLMSDHKKECLSCVRSTNCELQTLSNEYGCDAAAFQGERNLSEPDESTSYLVRDNEKCILCRRCVATCKSVQQVAVIAPSRRGFKTHIGCAFESDLADVPCVACGQCIAVCPTGALHEREEIDNVREAIADPEKVVVVAPAPAVRAAIGEEFGNPVGTNTEGKMFTALRMLGFDKVFDVNFAADLTIMEEANELVERVKEGGKLPMFTSCSPGWIRYVEYYYPELIPNLSSCKSPMQMFGATVKTYYAQKEGIDPKNIYVVGVMPCTAKKFERTRDDQSASGYPDIDAVLTTRELAKMIRTAGILYNELPDGTFDNPLGEFTGAGVIFGATGGVMEAALRTAAETITGKSLDAVDYKAVRGMQGIKEAEYDLNGLKVKVAVASGLTNAKALCEKIRKGECDYTFVEVMCCPGGCINGGGQPIQSAYTRRTVDIKGKRAKALYDEDKKSDIRKSHENPAVNSLYKEFFGAPGSHKAHEILHTKYVNRKK
ncbi:ferredoxin [Candidatus Borkfalkia ceftriaxoniphila]|uniref:Ferredoxin n=1 Tax=Candidatus Borkfalkia ceftriaxoniphila TaxID=2508949 RepID=A0A4V1QVA1_9FIRM|nr:NADH-dependent [FeFe] hydrogenase, group A6 [Candidatus Borkfalkia ceftriaxoniphila]RXZ61936.1 ferredoxin [Candidatus Borkfalkia ceftriaxoniphila]